MRVLKRIFVTLLCLVLFALSLLFVNDKANQCVFLTKYSFTHKDIPESFNGFKILMISDLHNAPFSDKIVKHIKKQSPDIIAVCGDIVQLPDADFTEMMKIAEEARDIPIYAVSGNHERQSSVYEDIFDTLYKDGIIILENDSVEIKRDSDSILLAGIKDPRHDVVTEEKLKSINNNIKAELPDDECFSILLSHRADLYYGIKDSGVDLILSGHLHGGIVRLPFVGGLVGKNSENSFFPCCEYGLVHEGKDSASMIVSGGCDKNPGKRRFFNPPEVVLITLQGE